MKNFFKEYLHLISTCMIGICLCFGCFYLLINSFHYTSMGKTITVSTNDVNYQQYISNIAKIKENVNNFKYVDKKYEFELGIMSNISSKLLICASILEGENSYSKVVEKEILNYPSVYELNNYFTNSVIDKCYVSNISWIIRDGRFDKTEYVKKLSVYDYQVKTLINNSKYIKTELRDNSSYYYNTSIANSMVRNNLGSAYQMVVSNYLDFSSMLVDLSNYLVEGYNG